MGRYATTTTISVRLPDFLDGNTTSSDDKGTEVFSSYVEKAEAMVDAAVATRYSLPFTTIPPLMRDLSFELAAYYTLRAFSSRDWPSRNDTMDDFKTSFETLSQLQKGEIQLTLTDGSTVARAGTIIMCSRDGEDPAMDVDEPTAWAVDQNRLDDLDGARQ
jgi:phage gp36-like protein